jgi:hypothetical protein
VRQEFYILQHSNEKLLSILSSDFLPPRNSFQETHHRLCSLSCLLRVDISSLLKLRIFTCVQCLTLGAEQDEKIFRFYLIKEWNLLMAIKAYS